MNHKNGYLSLLYEYDSELHDETLRKEGREKERAGNIRTLYSSLRASMSKENAVRWISDNLRVPLDEVSEILEAPDRQ